MEVELLPDEHVWVTGIYEPVKGDDWITFAYGPFPDVESADKEADDKDAVMKFLGDDVAKGDYEIVTVEPMTYSQACKHFEETIQSEFFEKLLPETHSAELALKERFSS